VTALRAATHLFGLGLSTKLSQELVLRRNTNSWLSEVAKFCCRTTQTFVQ